MLRSQPVNIIAKVSRAGQESSVGSVAVIPRAATCPPQVEEPRALEGTTCPQCRGIHWAGGSFSASLLPALDSALFRSISTGRENVYEPPAISAAVVGVVVAPLQPCGIDISELPW